MKGIILAGGSGSRLHPVTLSVCKQLLPIYDKPMIYYPLSVLMLAGIKDILMITTPEDQSIFQRLLNDGSHLGINISYEIQAKPEGIAQAFLIGDDFIGNDSVSLVLGDNIFFGHGLSNTLQKAAQLKKGAQIFGYYVDDPDRYGVAELTSDFQVLSIEEKPKIPKSNYAVTGLYFYDNTVAERAKKIKPSARGELEITAINNSYLKDNQLSMNLLGRGTAWLDTGTHSSLLDASNFIETIQTQQGQYVACLEEVAFRMGFISLEMLIDIAENVKSSSYGQYLKKLAAEVSHERQAA